MEETREALDSLKGRNSQIQDNPQDAIQPFCKKILFTNGIFCDPSQIRYYRAKLLYIRHLKIQQARFEVYLESKLNNKLFKYLKSLSFQNSKKIPKDLIKQISTFRCLTQYQYLDDAKIEIWSKEHLYIFKSVLASSNIKSISFQNPLKSRNSLPKAFLKILDSIFSSVNLRVPKAAILKPQANQAIIFLSFNSQKRINSVHGKDQIIEDVLKGNPYLFDKKLLNLSLRADFYFEKNFLKLINENFILKYIISISLDTNYAGDTKNLQIIFEKLINLKFYSLTLGTRPTNTKRYNELLPTKSLNLKSIHFQTLSIDYEENFSIFMDKIFQFSQLQKLMLYFTNTTPDLKIPQNIGKIGEKLPKLEALALSDESYNFDFCPKLQLELLQNISSLKQLKIKLTFKKNRFIVNLIDRLSKLKYLKDLFINFEFDEQYCPDYVQNMPKFDFLQLFIDKLRDVENLQELQFVVESRFKPEKQYEIVGFEKELKKLKNLKYLKIIIEKQFNLQIKEDELLNGLLRMKKIKYIVIDTNHEANSTQNVLFKKQLMAKGKELASNLIYFDIRFRHLIIKRSKLMEPLFVFHDFVPN